MPGSPGLTISCTRRFDVAGVGERVAVAIRLEVKRHADVVRRHDVHQRRDEAVHVAVAAPLAHIDRPSARVVDPLRVLFEHLTGS